MNENPNSIVEDVRKALKGRTPEQLRGCGCGVYQSMVAFHELLSIIDAQAVELAELRTSVGAQCAESVGAELAALQAKCAGLVVALEQLPCSCRELAMGEIPGSALNDGCTAMRLICARCAALTNTAPLLAQHDAGVEQPFRKLLWIFHGCSGLYGDDGEMQCGKCLIDFRRDPIGIIQKQLTSRTLQKLAEAERIRNEGGKP